MLESALEKRFRQWCKSQGYLCLKITCLGFVGFPDRTILMPGGEVAFVELKQQGKLPAKIQEKWLRDLTKLGFLAYWADNFDDATAPISEGRR